MRIGSAYAETESGGLAGLLVVLVAEVLELVEMDDSTVVLETRG